MENNSLSKTITHLSQVAPGALAPGAAAYFRGRLGVRHPAGRVVGAWPCRCPQFRRAAKITSQVAPRGGKEHPSRGRAAGEVTILIQTIPKRTRDSDDHAWGSVAHRLRWQGVFGGILVFALLGNSVQALTAATPAGPSVTLTWNPSPDTNVVGYNVYYGGASGTYTNLINAGNVTNATIAGLSAGATYYFAAKAYDALGDQSVFSNEASYAMPATAVPSAQNRASRPEELPAGPGFVPATLAGLQMRALPTGRMVLTLTAPSGQTNEIQATQDFSVWTTIGTVTVGPGGTLDFADTNAANFPQRFYRTQETHGAIQPKD